MEGTFGMLKFLFPQIPTLASTAAWHTLGRSPTSSKWDLKTALTVQVLRHMLNDPAKNPMPIGKVQATTLKDPGVIGKTWVAKATINAPGKGEENIREAVFQAIDEMKVDGAPQPDYTKPELVNLEVEWTGFRPDALKTDRMPDISEEEKYQRLMSEPGRTSETTLLYFHGGAYYLCDPATHRALTRRLAKESKGRVCSTRYRLAPQTAFPGQLLDALMLYLSLIYPPFGSLHESVPASNIILAGDSAGGNLAFALLQLLLQLHRQSKNPRLRFHGKEVEVPLPAGTLANSGWFDICRAMPTLTTNAKYDYLPTPEFNNEVATRYPPDDIWPSKPPRGDMFCHLSILDHPLVSPLAADSWEGSPPMWFCTGQEMLSDEDTILASRAASQGVKVQFEEYEAMPHCFAMLLPSLPSSDRCLRNCGEFCRRCVEEPGEIKTKGAYTYAKTLQMKEIDVEKATQITVEEAKQMMAKVREKRYIAFQKGDFATPKASL
jgi:acetyl esterase/lipase